MDIYVNIKNMGYIPFVDEQGPLFGYKVSEGLYGFLKLNPNIDMEVVHNLADAKEAKRKYFEQKKKEKEERLAKESKHIIINEVPPVSDAPVISEKLEKDAADEDIDKILETSTYTTHVGEQTAEVLKDMPSSENKAVRKYSDAELATMTTKQLKKILNDRGYFASREPFVKSNPYAPKYHDTLDVLIYKVKKTQ